jgi:hypothetical protein
LNAMADPPICEFFRLNPVQGVDRCPYGEVPGVKQYEGHFYCRAHAPLEAPFGYSPDEVSSQIISRLDDWDGKLDGLVFRQSVTTDVSIARANALPVSMKACCFVGHGSLSLQGIVNLEGTEFRKTARISLHQGEMNLCDVSFNGDVAFFCQSEATLPMRKAIFRGEVAIHNSSVLKSMDARDCHFAVAPTFKEQSKLPQNTSFRGARFANKTAFSAVGESRFREIRNLLHDNRDREQEGRFFAYEKRSYRKSSDWIGWNCISRPLSYIYDLVSHYGQSYEVALLWLALMQLGFGFAYAARSGRLGLGVEIDRSVLQFTLAQVARPFELLSGRPATAEFYVDVIGNGGAWWSVMTAVQSVVTYAMIAIVFIALRWRFRRE